MDLKKILPFFSYIYHPIFISVYGTIFYFLVSKMYTYPTLFYMTLLQVGILTLLLPLSLYYLFFSIGLVNSFTEASLKERKIPIIIQAILLFILIKFSSSFDNIPELYYFFFGGFLSSLLAFIAVSLKFKASLHMIAICLLATFIYAISLHLQLPLKNSIAFIIVSVGFVASSRLHMKSHTPIELIIGSFIGILSQVSFWYFWL
ncbi:hypothetical protein FIA58_015025 [Flavobacterium jejuense]|uniref:Phosphatidic acid phosphatase type 2/haloperoxidase domain-containing protein n=1 Tax=Flavobacterium jejuense TaxID=1544455 RepID=A0ABX0IZ23_9FLAO|nr:hypothetical protein [Flavobacterium jejuense]NHN26994.1 hypothetical protein [Flavobacterium jejuense]